MSSKRPFPPNPSPNTRPLSLIVAAPVVSGRPVLIWRTTLHHDQSMPIATPLGILNALVGLTTQVSANLPLSQVMPEAPTFLTLGQRATIDVPDQSAPGCRRSDFGLVLGESGGNTVFNHGLINKRAVRLLLPTRNQAIISSLTPSTAIDFSANQELTAGTRFRVIERR